VPLVRRRVVVLPVVAVIVDRDGGWCAAHGVPGDPCAALHRWCHRMVLAEQGEDQGGGGHGSSWLAVFVVDE
jgi:hypothetical protein